MALKRHRIERRHPGRPSNGDVKRCPKCGRSTCEFSERYRLEGKGVAAGWLCDAPGCGFRQLMRPAPSGAADPGGLIRGSRELRARAQRQMMKSRSKIARSEKRIAASGRRVDKKR